MITLEEYQKAQQIVKDYCVCGNSGFGCGKLFKVEETEYVIQYGNQYRWCKKCYEQIKNEW